MATQLLQLKYPEVRNYLGGSFVDAHLPRPGWEHWESLRALLALALPAEVEWFDSYFAEWMKS